MEEHTLAVMLAEYVHHWDEETTEENKHFDVLEARQYLTAFVRLFSIEELVERIAHRLYEHEYSLPWEDQSSKVRNHFLTRALDGLDALKDEIVADPEYKFEADDDRRFIRALDNSEPKS